MPSDNRERSFENALAAHLRADATINPHPECADAETLAAFRDGSLPPQQVAALKSHIAACERCREILTTLEATAEIPAPSLILPEAAPAAAKPRLHVLPVRRKTAVWRWIAPAGALAAAFLAWVAVRENTPSITLKNPTPAAMQAPAEHQSQALREIPLPPASQTVEPGSSDSGFSSSSPRALQSKPQSKISTLSPRIVPKRKDSLDSAKSDIPPEFDQFADSSTTRDESLNRSAISAPNLSADNKSITIAPATPELKEKLSKRRQDAGVASSSKPALEANAASAAPPAPAPSMPPPLARAQASSESAAVSRGALQQQEMDGMSRFKQNPELRLANSLAEITISAPDGHASWRVGQAGIIEFSSDAGKSWAVQPSGVITDLLAGSAISAKLCWIVGRAGTILRTTDAGAHWKKINPPTQDDLCSVFAVDPQQAIVSSTSAQFQTLDGGITWKKIPPE